MSVYKYLLFFGLVFFVGSLLCGIAEMNYLGPNINHSALAPIFSIFGVKMETEFGVVIPVISQIKASWDLIINMVTWNYSVLDASTLGQTIRIPLLFMSFAFIFSLIVTIVSTLRGGGS